MQTSLRRKCWLIHQLKGIPHRRVFFRVEQLYFADLSIYTLHGHKLRFFTLWEAQFVTGGIIQAACRPAGDIEETRILPKLGLNNFHPLYHHQVDTLVHRTRDRINGRDPARGVTGNFTGEEAALPGKQINAGMVIPWRYEMLEFNTVSP
jgi:hypothetical protein